MIVLVLACRAPDPVPVERPEPSPPAPAPAPAPAPVPTIPEPTACEARRSGTICRWMGIEDMAMFSAESEPRLQASLNLPVDLTWGPDGRAYVVDHNSHRIRVVEADDTVHTLVGVGVIGDGIYDPTTGLWNDGPGVLFKINHPTDVVFSPLDPGGFYIAAWHNSRVERYDFATAEVQYLYGTGARAFEGDGGPASDAAFDLPVGLAFDALGALYVADQANQVIRHIGTDGVIETVVGVPKVLGYNGAGPALATTLSASTGSYLDPSTKLALHEGQLWFVDTEAHLVRRYDPATASVHNVAGTYVQAAIGIDTDGDYLADLYVGEPGYAGDGGPALAARLNRPRDLAIAADGTLYVADTGNHCIRVVTPDGIIDTYAGTCGVDGLSEPDRPADEIPARDALLDRPMGVALDAAGNLYIADTYRQVIRVVWR